MHGDVIEQQARLEIVRAVQNQREPAQQFLGIFRTHVGDDALDRDAGIDGAQAALGRDGFWQCLPGVGFLKQGLPLQVRGLDEIAVHDPQSADAGAHQQIRQRRAQRAAAHNHRRRFEQALLARLADFGEENLPGIAFV